MTRISTGTVTVTNNSKNVTAWVGVGGVTLSPITAPVGSQIAIDGVANFIEARPTSTTLTLVMPHTGATGTLKGAAISAMTAEEAQIGTLNERTALVIQELSVLDANGRGLFFNMTGAAITNPGNGKLSLNNATPELATLMYLSVTDANEIGRDVQGLVNLWGAGTVLILRSIATTAYYSYRLTATPVFTSGVATIGVEFIEKDGVLVVDEPMGVDFRLSGEDRDVDATVNDLAGRAAYDASPSGFRVMVANIGGGIAARYEKLSNTSGHWSAAARYTGPEVAVSVGTTTTGAAGTNASVANSGTSAAPILDFTIPRGNTGVAGADGRDPGVLMNWSTTTTDADPGNGLMRANNASLASATQLYIDTVNRAGSSISTFLNTFDDSTSPVKGQIILTRVSDNAQAIFNVTSITVASGYYKVNVTAHSGTTTLTNAQPVSLQFYRTGDSGAGSGDMIGPASSVAANLVGFASTNGKNTVDSGVAASNIVLKSANGSDFADKRATLDNLQLQGANIASAATLNLSTATGHFIDVTGTTTTTAITLSDGSQRLVRAAGVWPITVGANLVLNNGGSNYTCAVGDLILFVADGTVIRGAVFPVSGVMPGAQVALSTVSQAEAEAGTSTTVRNWTAQRVGQAISALSPPTDVSALALAIADLQGYRLGFKGGMADAYDDQSGVYLGVSGGNDVFTTLLLHGNGGNGSTAFADSSPSGLTTFTVVGNAQIATDQSKFGGASMKFDGSGDYIQYSNPAGLNFGTGDFTIDMHFRLASISTSQSLYDARPSEGLYPYIFITSANKIVYYVNSVIRITSTTTVTTATWYHVAVVRSGTTTTMYVNGVAEGGTWSDSTNYGLGTNKPVIGIALDGVSNPLNGWIDELRVSKGIARWTSNFTVPTSEYTGYTGGSLEIVYDSALDLYKPASSTYTASLFNVLDSDGSNLGSRQIRQRYPASAVGTSGTGVALRIMPSSSGGSTAIEHMFIGHAGTGEDFDGSQVRVTFNGGSNGITIAAGAASVTSDDVVFALDETKDLMISAQFTDEAPNGRVNAGAAAGYVRYTKAGSGDYATTDVSGYTATASRIWLPVDLVAVRTGGGTLSNMTLISTPVTATAVPTVGRLSVQLDTALTVTPTTDITAEISRDGGTTYTAGTLSLTSTVGTIKTYDTPDVSLTGQPSGTSMVYRVKTLTNKNIPVSGTVLQWR